MTALYQINQELLDLINNADPETGLIDEEAFEKLTIEKSEKQLNIARFIKHVANDIEVIKKEKERLDALTRTMEARQDWLKKYLRNSMEIDGKTELDFTLFKAKIKQNPASVKITDEARIDPQYILIKTTSSPDKKRIAEVLKGGGKVDGAELVQGSRLEVK